MKRILLVIALIFLLTGCGVRAIDLNEEQSDIIAEKASSLLLKGDRRYSDSYVETIYVEKKESLQDTTAAEESDSVEQTNAVTEDTEISNQVLPESEAQNNATEINNSDVSTNTKGAQSNANASGANSIAINQMASIIGIPQLNVTYQGYDTGDTYPNTVNNDVAVDFTSREGYGLLVLKFELENPTNEVQQCDLLNQNNTYQFDINGTRHTFEATVLINDLATLSDKFQPSEKKEAVLIAQIKDGEWNQINSLTLFINKDNTQYSLTLK